LATRRRREKATKAHAGKPSGLLCSSHALAHHYQDEESPGCKPAWRRKAKRIEDRLWKREAEEEQMTAFYEITDVFTIPGLENIYMDVEDISDGGDFYEEIVMSVEDAEELRDMLTDAIDLMKSRGKR